MRMFLAIRIPEEPSQAISRFIEHLRRHHLEAAWVKPEAMHLTLRFLGNVEADTLPKLMEELERRMAGLPKPTLLVRNTGAFPSLKRPSVVWAGVETVRGSLSPIQQACEQAAQAIGIPRETKTFHPHLTLARIRNPQAAQSFASFLSAHGAANAPLEFGRDFEAEKVILFSSELTRQGPIHRPAKELPLT